MNSSTAQIALRLEAHDIFLIRKHIISPEFRVRRPHPIVTRSTSQQQVNRDRGLRPKHGRPPFSGMPKDIDSTEKHAAAPPRDTGQGGSRQVGEHPLPTWILLGGQPNSKGKVGDSRVLMRHHHHQNQFDGRRRAQHRGTLLCGRRQFRGLQYRVPGHHVWPLRRALQCASLPYELFYVAVDNSENSSTVSKNASSVHATHWSVNVEGTDRRNANASHDLHATGPGSSRCSKSGRLANSFRRPSGEKDRAECSCFFGLLVSDTWCFSISRASARPRSWRCRLRSKPTSTSPSL